VIASNPNLTDWLTEVGGAGAFLATVVLAVLAFCQIRAGQARAREAGKRSDRHSRLPKNSQGHPNNSHSQLFRRAAGSLLLANGKTLKQVQGCLRHSQLTTTMNVYITQVEDGLGSADLSDKILPSGPTSGPKDAAATSGGPGGGPSSGFEAPEGVADEEETQQTRAISRVPEEGLEPPTRGL
jgi:hypothetical protein